jgi:hypothetical protein
LCVQTLVLKDWDDRKYVFDYQYPDIPIAARKWAAKYSVGETADDDTDGDDGIGNGEGEESVPKELLDCDFVLVREKVQRVCPDRTQARFWMWELKRGHADAWVALLLTLLPNLRLLPTQFPRHCRWVGWMVWRVAQADVGANTYLAHVLEQLSGIRADCS